MMKVFLNMDCMEGMAEYPDKFFDLAIVDPPYGAVDAIGLVNSNGHSANRKDYKLFENVAPSDDYFDELRRISKNQIIWGGNFFGLKGGYLCWQKNGTCFGEAEMAYCSIINSVRIYEFTWNGMIQGDMKNKEFRIHPTQKPVHLYRALLKEYGEAGWKILDTHVGSGSSLIACEMEGFDYVGFEIDKDYYEAAQKRIKQFRQQSTLFDQHQYEKAKVKQLDLQI